MRLNNFDKNIWNEMIKTDNPEGGYSATFITINDQSESELLIFLDENNRKHLVIEINEPKLQTIKDPNINGLKLSIKKFKFYGRDIKQYIDLECGMNEYVDEFTEIAKEISTEILVLNNEPIESVMDVIETWRSFLASRIKEVLSDEEQIGLLCELIILKRLCDINPGMALNSWRGPLGEKHDFVFTDWAFEIKGTRSSSHLHWINGIDQLKKPQNKDLIFVSFLLTMAQSEDSLSIQSLIQTIINDPLKNKPPLIEDFYKLLVAAGYSKTFSEEYRKLRFDINDCLFLNVDENFPKLTSQNLSSPLSNRVSNIKYIIDLQGINSQNIDSIQWGNYFY